MILLGRVTAFSVMACAIAILVAACGAGGGSSSSTVPSNRTAASDVLFTDPATPINISVVLDTVRAVSQVVSAAGGTLNATSADGSQYTLDIPAGAVQQDTTITMTPLISASGVPLTNGMVAGVQFSPDALFLYKDAMLTIVPAASVPVGNQTFLGYSGAGNDLHLVPPASPTAAIQMRVGHFSGIILGDGSAADRVALYTSRALDAEARLDQEVARIFTQERQLQILGVSDGSVALAGLSSYFPSYYELVIRPLIFAASSSCANTTLAMQKYLGFGHRLEVLGGALETYDPNGADLQRIVSAYDDTCNALANRYTGTFTASQTTAINSYSTTGNVTFLRDDAVCMVLGISLANTACYRVESVTYTTTTTPLNGCVLSQPSSTVSLLNTSIIDSHLIIDPSVIDPIGAVVRPYNLVAFWSIGIGYSVTCPYGVNWGGGADWAALASDPANKPAVTTGAVAGSYTNASSNFTWSLTAAP